MTHSALAQYNPIDPFTGQPTLAGYVRVDDGTISPPILHLSPDTPVPNGATVLMPNDTTWTWGDFATAFPALAAHCLPNEWAGEPTAQDVTVTAFPLLAPPPGA